LVLVFTLKIAGAEFSPDGKLLYFVCSAWATSGAVHVIDGER